ncbi:Alpha/Beta hydrolase protein [Lipomyces tetrasporus]
MELFIRRHENCTSSTGSRTNENGPPDNQVIDVDIPFDVRTLHVRLEGSSDQESLVLVFLNELLTDMHIWDYAISLLKQELPKVRFLRYDTRCTSRDSTGSAKEINLDVLSADVANVMSVLGIPRARSVIGVGLGGATALAFASRYPDRLDRFVACDFNIASNKKLVSEWDSRLHYARTYGMSGVLANKVVAIWFTADSRGSPEWERVREMVGSWSLDDFEATAKAQYSYDETEKMRTIQIPGLFVVGSEDGILPEVMSAFPEKKTQMHL